MIKYSTSTIKRCLIVLLFLTDCTAIKKTRREWESTGWIDNGQGLLYKLVNPGDMPKVNDTELAKVFYVYYDYQTYKTIMSDTAVFRLNEVEMVPGFETSVMLLGNHGKGLFKIPKNLAGGAPDSRKFDYMLYEIEVLDCPERK